MKFGLLGKKLNYSKSGEIHKELSDYEYNMIECDEDRFNDFMKSNDYSGFNITIPYKKAVIPYCSFLSDTAKRTGSVNTVFYDVNGKLHGYNTDYYGLIYALNTSGINVENKKVIIFGSGGTASTTKTALWDMGAKKVSIISRSGENTYDNLTKFRDSEILINTTPVGTYPQIGKSIGDIDDFPYCTGVFDVIYNPMRTAIIDKARRKNLSYSNGFPMLVAQAKYASAIFEQKEDFKEWDIDFSMDTDSEIERIIKKLTGELVNIILIGMPGSGKTIIGELISEKMCKKFIDTDKLIEKESGKTISQIFEEQGEETFREMESDIISSVCKETGQVIATGGGAVLKEKNLYAMHSNGLLIWIKRDLKKLSLSGRPLSKDLGALETMYEKRKLLYEINSDISVTNDFTVTDTATKIIEKIIEMIDNNGGFR